MVSQLVETISTSGYSIFMKGWPSAFKKHEQLNLIQLWLPFLTHKEIWEVLCISKATFYRRLEQLKRLVTPSSPTEEEREQVIRALKELEAAARASNNKRNKK